ncbi:hypothetical protein GE061_000993 [Apolygus lucorum]|uniref:Uncharacterized protein n=1 Tax=Apolygus lucorum TaxID=248454 RepID=A0A6A4JCX0_APOLU|nr:hypothetical protein GE061_009157 [Apolygus lucorum]KAF6216647.1 hypothetical protein GE061_000993 [Apolygus lucorum]
MDQNATPDQVADAGARFIAAVYSGASNTTLNDLRLHHFEKALSKVNFSLASLPPTAAAARQHSLRVFLQVQLWKGIAMDPKKGHSCSNSIDEDHYTSFDEEVDILNEQADMASDITPDDTDDDEEAYPSLSDSAAPVPGPSGSAAPVPGPSGSAAPAPKRARFN